MKLFYVLLAVFAFPLHMNDNNNNLYITAWIHKNDWRIGVASLAAHASLVSEASPAWYAPAADGSITELPEVPVDDPSLRDITRESHMILRPLIMNTIGSTFDGAFIGSILADRSRKNAHLAAIVALATEHHYDGITIDYENIPNDALPAFADFIQELGVALHAQRKTLGVTVAPKQLGLENAAAWHKIGAAADLVYLMAYPEHTANTVPGPIASVDWVRAQLKKALAVIPVDKLSLGMPTYAIVWGKPRSGSGSWKVLVAPVLAQGATVMRGDDGSPYLVTQSATGAATIWYEDALSIAKKFACAREFGITHFALWRLGGEDPTIWSVFAKQQSTN